VVTSYQKEQCLTFVQEFFPKLSYAKACKLVSCSRTNKYYKKVIPEKDVVVKEAYYKCNWHQSIRAKKSNCKSSKEASRYGGSKNQTYLPKGRFSLYKRMKKRRVDNPANPIEVPLSPNIEWAMDFMSDSLANGKKFRTLNIIDQYNRKCLKIGINFTLPSRKVIEILERTIDEYGKPLGIRTDNGPEFTSCLFQNWLDKNDIEWIKIQKGKPQQNAIVERFNRTYREDILDDNLFFSLEHVYEVTQPWKEDYNPRETA
jgi:putative transposase